MGISVKNNSQNEGLQLLTPEEAAKFLGLKKSYLYRLTCKRQIPFYKYGGHRVLFERESLEAWRAERLQAVPTAQETMAKATAYCVANPLKR